MKIFPMKYFIFYFLIISTSIWAQKPANLTQQQYLALQEKVTTSIDKNIDSAFVYAKQIEVSSNNAHKAFAIAAMAHLFQLKGDSIKSKQSYQKANFFLNKVPLSREKKILESNILNFGGLIDWNRKDLKNALEKFQAGLSIAKETRDPVQTLKFNMNIALILIEVGNFNSAIVSLRESDRIANSNKDLFSKDKFDYYNSNINSYLGSCYAKAFVENKSLIKLLDSAKVYYTKAILFSKEYPLTKVNCKIGLGNIAYQKEDFVTAQKVYYDVLLFSKQNDLKPEYFIASYNLGDLFFNRNEWDKSLVFFQKVDSIYKITKINDWVYINANYYMAKIYSAKNNPKEALRCSNIYLDNFEKVQSKMDNQVSEVNFSIGKDNLKKEMEELQYQNKKKIGLVLLLLVVAIVFFYFFIQTIRLKAKNKIKDMQSEMQLDMINASIDGQELERKTIAAFLHDNLSSLLSSAGLHLSVFISQNKSQPEEIIKTKKILEDAHHQIRNLSHELMPTLLVQFGLLYALEDICEKSSNSKIKFEFRTSIPIQKRYHEDFEMKLYFIINELINNSIKHSQADKAEINIEEIKDKLSIVVKDNGIGFVHNAFQVSEGFGINQIRARINNMKGEFTIESAPNKGTVIRLKVPILDPSAT